VPTEELEARKASLIGSFSRSLETTQGLADGVASLAISGLPVGELTQHIARLQAIGPADVQGFAARHFEHGNRRVAVAGVASEFEPALKQAGPLLTIEQRAFDLDASAPPKAR
jgi:zinc protease